jgi:hypothetical protein
VSCRVMSCHVSRTRTWSTVEAAEAKKEVFETHCVKVVADQPYERRVLGGLPSNIPLPKSQYHSSKVMLPKNIPSR